VLFVLLPLAGRAQQPRASTLEGTAAVAQLEKTFVDVIARAEPSVVAVSRTAPQQLAGATGRDVFAELRNTPSDENAAITVGAGVIIDRSGLILTHYLAVHEGDQHAVTTIDRITYPATIRAADPRSGLAVLAIDPKAKPLQRPGTSPPATVPDGFPAIKLGDAAAVRKGQFVIAIGNPFAIQTDGQPTASWGIVTNLARKAPAGANFNDASGPGGDYRTTLHHLGTLIQTDAKLGFGAPGGALINLRGELIGLTTNAATIAGHEQPAGYAIPMNATTRRIIDTLKQGREVEYGMLGVGFGHLAIDSAINRGPRLTLVQVFPGGPAARAGLAQGDIVTGVGRQAVDDIDAIQLAISKLPPGSVTTVDYIRNGNPARANVTLAKLAIAGKKFVSVRSGAWHGLRVDYATALDAADLAQAASAGAMDPDGCVVVTEVEENSDAWNAGVRKGMFINYVGAKRVTTPGEFAAATKAMGDKFSVRLTQPVAEPEKEKPKSPAR
jgi:S1-C subfamily serine protease